MASSNLMSAGGDTKGLNRIYPVSIRSKGLCLHHTIASYINIFITRKQQVVFQILPQLHHCNQHIIWILLASDLICFCGQLEKLACQQLKLAV